MRVFMDRDIFKGMADHEGLSYEPIGLTDFERQALSHNNLGHQFFEEATSWDRPEQERARETIKAWSNFESFA